MLFIIKEKASDPSVMYRVMNFVTSLREREYDVRIVQYEKLEELTNGEIDDFLKPHRKVVFFRPDYSVDSRVFKHIYQKKDQIELYASYDDPTFIIPFLLEWHQSYKMRSLFQLDAGFQSNKFWFDLFDNFIASTPEMAELILKEKPNAKVVTALNYIPLKTYDHCQPFLAKKRKKSIIIPQGGIFHSQSFEKMIDNYERVFNEKKYDFYSLPELQKEALGSPAIKAFVRKTYVELCCYISEFQLAIAPIFNKETCYSKSNIKLLECMVSNTPLVTSDIPSMLHEKDCPLLTLVGDDDDWYEKIIETIENKALSKVNFDSRTYLKNLEQSQVDIMAEMIEA